MITSIQQLYSLASKIEKEIATKGSDAWRKFYIYNARPVIHPDGSIEWYSPQAIWSSIKFLVQIKPGIYVTKDIYENLKRKEAKIVSKPKGGETRMYVTYKGKRIPFGEYVIWDDTRNIYLAFSNINALNQALQRYGYVKDHHAVRPGYYTRYGYFSNDILYDLYLRYRFPEVYSPTAQRIVAQHFNEYNRNPQAFRQKLLQNPQVKREIETKQRQYAIKSGEQKIIQLEKEIEQLRQAVKNQPNLIPVLQTLQKEYESMLQLLKSLGAKPPVQPVYVYQEIPKPVTTTEEKVQEVMKIIAPIMLLFVVIGVFFAIKKLLR